MVINLTISVILGFFASFVVQQAMKLLLGLRAHWLHTVTATCLIAGICGLSFSLSSANLDPKAATYFAKVFFITLFLSTGTGVPIIRFNIHGEQGDQPGWGAAAGMTALVVGPLLSILSLLYLVSN